MALSTVAKRRLTKLVEFVASLPRSADKHFSMDTWCAHDGDRHDHLASGDVVERKHVMTCGTTACVVGWAATMPYFKKLGLEMRWDRYDAALFVNGRRDMMFDSVPVVFDINYGQAVELFGADKNDKTPRAWAKRARAWMREQASAA